MNKFYLVAMFLLLGGCNAAYYKAVNEQLAEGYRWVDIPCRPANPDVPSITMESHDGQKLVCSVLQK